MKKNNTLMIVLGVFALVIVTTATSFAFFQYQRTGNTKVNVTSGDITFSYMEDNQDASLTNAFPVADAVGAVDTTGEYEFTVSMTSSSSTTVTKYNVILLDNNNGTGNYFNNDQIKFALVKNNVYVVDTSATKGLKLSEVSGFTSTLTTGEGTVLSDQEITSGTTDTYKLRIWISDDVSYNNTIDENGQETGKYNGYSYSLKVKVTSGTTNGTTAIENVNVTNEGVITADISDPSGLKAYAVTNSSTAPVNDSNEWIEVTSETAMNESNIVRMANSLITSKTISYTATKNGTYYIHVKNNSDEIVKKQVIVETTGVQANVPDLTSNMIPVTYNGSNWIKADVNQKWYDYNEQWWANAVTVSAANRSSYMNASAGTIIPMSDINTMWVWIPRYEYENITSTTATEIKVKFLSGTSMTATSNYNVHPAFTFGTEELTGIWVAKFETSSSSTCTATNGDINKGCDITTLNPIVKPNVTSWRGIRTSTAFTVSRNMESVNNIYGFVASEVDTHMMKNTEWGAAAYLSQSKYGKYGNSNYSGDNKEIYQNKSNTFITGMSNGTPGSSTTNTQVTYNVEGTGTGASTTGNIYGIYDMSGGALEYVMGVVQDNTNTNIPMSGNSTTYNSGFIGKIYASGSFTQQSGRVFPESKYYDLYAYGTTYNDSAAYARNIKGDATTETKGWYADGAHFVTADFPWFVRGGSYNDSTFAGAFYFSRGNGGAYTNGAFRLVIVK